MAKKRAVKRKTKKTKRKTTKAKRKTKKKAFGGYSISFKNRDESLEQVFGKGNLAPSEMTKKLWKFIKSKRLANK
jgi:chromatin remodeling complex protein RSC6